MFGKAHGRTYCSGDETCMACALLPFCHWWLWRQDRQQKPWPIRDGHEEHLLEVVTDAGYAGNQYDRKSTSSFQRRLSMAT